MLSARQYAKHFKSRADLKLRKIGIEKEYPVIDAKTHEAADVRPLFIELARLGWQTIFDDVYKDVIVGVQKNGYVITTDAGWCTLEIASRPEDSLWKLQKSFADAQKLVVGILRSFGLSVLGYGIQPKTLPRAELWIHKRRHDLIRQILPPEVDWVTVTAADQVHVDIAREEIVDATNALNALAGIFIAFFANSPIVVGGFDSAARLTSREDVWLPLGRGRVGIPLRPFKNLGDLIRYLSDLEFCVARSGEDYVLPKMSFRDFTSDMSPEDREFHWRYHEGALWFDARPRIAYGTIEVRPACSGRDGENIYLAAFILGLVENLTEVIKVADRRDWQKWHNLKTSATNNGFYARTGSIPITDYCFMLLKLAESGLRKRALGEERLLAPLWGRLAEKTNPANIARRIFVFNGWEAFIESVTIR